MTQKSNLPPLHRENRNSLWKKIAYRLILVYFALLCLIGWILSTIYRKITGKNL